MQLNLPHLLEHAVSQKASDLHLSAGLPPILRIDGFLAFTGFPIVTQAELSAFIDHFLSKRESTLFAQGLEIDTVYTLGCEQRFRVNLYQQERGFAAAFRVIQHPIPTLKSLDLPAIFATLAETAHGLILISGPTGSGKSSSLAALIQHINSTQAKHVIILEDPIEFIHTNNTSLVSQLSVKQHTKSFSQGLRAALRQDPDVIVIGELRDLSTIRLALIAAETGHLVLATLHAATAVQAIDRVIDVFSGDEKNAMRKLLADSLKAVIAQRFSVQSTGGRKAEFEILVCTPAIRNLIREGNKNAQIYSAMLAGGSQGMKVF